MISVKSPMQLGAVLRETRTALRLPVSDLAAMVGTTPVTLRRLEQGPPTSAIATLFSLLNELGLELNLSLPPGVGPFELPCEKSKPRRTRVKP